MKDKISIIIPVYNAEKYLDRCIQSIMNQTYQNLEIIIIDDGSNDDSYKLAMELSEKDSRIIVKKINNSGVSRARNIGLKYSVGDFVCFIDSDDWIDKYMIERMYLLQRKKAADIVQCSFGIFYEDNCTKTYVYKEKEYIGKKQILIGLAGGNIANSVCNKMFSRSILNNVFFDESIAIGEDYDFVYRCCLNAKKVYIDTTVYYYYFQREDSAMHETLNEKNFQPIRILDMQLKDNVTNSEVYRAFAIRKVYMCIDIILKILIVEKYYNQLDDLIYFVRKNAQYVLVRNDCNIKVKMMIIVLLVSPSFFTKFYKLINSPKRL